MLSQISSTLSVRFADSRGYLRIFALLATSLLLCVSGLAQSTTDGAIGGTVYDANGAVVPNATVTVHNNGTNAEQRITTDASGYYRVRQLQPATYTVTVNSTGFSPYKAENVVVQVGSLTDVSPRLGVAGAAETVSVTAETPEINTSSPDFAPVVDATQVQNLPINGGRWSEFALLTPTVLNNGSGFGLISVRGVSVLLNNNTVDGADNNQAFFSEERGRTRAGYSTPKTAVQEFQVNTSNYSAEYGRAAGAVINTVTKSGTNALHGEAYFYDRDNDWGAKNPYTTVFAQTGPGQFTKTVIKPKDWRKIWGLSIGGPIIKDRLFFYFNYDQFRRNFPGVAALTNPTAFFAAPTASQLNTLSGNLGITTAAAQTLYTTAQNDFIGELGTVPRTGEQIIFLPKVDWNISSKNHASFELNRMRWHSPAGIQTQANVNFANSSFGNDDVKDTWGIAKLNTFITNTLANEARFQYGRDFEFEHPQPANAYEQAHLLHPTGYTNPLGIPPNVFFSFNSFNFGTATFLDRAAFPDERRTQFADTITWSHGNHNLKFGGDILRTDDLSQNLRLQFGEFLYTSFENYVSDLTTPNRCGAAHTLPCYSNYQQGFGPLGLEFQNSDIGLFAQDDWKILPRLTLNLGLRWDYETMPDPKFPNTLVPQSTALPSDKNNLGPRVGFAYDLSGNGTSVVRGGYGIFFGRIINSTIYNALINTGNPSGQASFTFNGTSNTTPGAPPFPQILTSLPTGATTAKPNVVFLDKHFQAPQIHEADLTFQHDLGHNNVVSLSWLGSYSRELPGFVDSNIAPATSTIRYTIQPGGPLPAGTVVSMPLYTARLNSAFGSMTDVFSGLNGSYNALAAQFTHRMTKNVEFNANYTWAHAIDYNQNESTFSDTNDLFDPYNLSLEKGNSIYDVPNRFVFNAVAQTPWRLDGWKGILSNGWEIAPLVQIQDGLPYSLTTSGGAPSGTGALLSSTINGSGGRSGLPILQRNSFRFPGTQVVDLRISKHFAFHDRYSLELLGEAFNLLNHFNATGITTLGYKTGGTAAAPILTPNVDNTGTLLFGQVTNANSNFAYSPRQVQLGVRLMF
ncbi:MAG TPA: TonB-dependent receptor [Terriglobales bacterium]|nr:TonB-dependent receptor [Terriglobales bacterium]